MELNCEGSMFRLPQHRGARSALLLCLAPFAMGSLGQRQNLELRLLAAHNQERSAIGVPALQWDSKLAADARQWAGHLASAARFEHSPDEHGTEPTGENLWAGTARHYGPETMVALWISEKEHFQPGVFPYNSRSGRVESVSHYTQLIWARTRKVGCALQTGAQEDFLVCRYSQAGNVIGERPV